MADDIHGLVERLGEELDLLARVDRGQTSSADIETIANAFIAMRERSGIDDRYVDSLAKRLIASGSLSSARAQQLGLLLGIELEPGDKVNFR